MSGQIRITPEDMRSRAGEYRTEADNIENVIAKMDSLIAALQEEWEGAASTSFAQQYAEIKPHFEQGRDLVNTVAGQLDSTATSIEDLDQDISSKFVPQ